VGESDDIGKIKGLEDQVIVSATMRPPLSIDAINQVKLMLAFL
jgi:hypothetical protein